VKLKAILRLIELSGAQGEIELPKIQYERIGEYVKTALQVLMENEDGLSSKEVILKVGQRLSFNEYELHRYEKSGDVRWESILHFYSISAVKAEWLIKNKGIWYITPEGKDVTTLSNREYFDLSEAKYKEWWDNNRSQKETNTEQLEDAEEIPTNPTITFDKASNDANYEIEEFIRRRGPYEFQDLVAALLRGMGYHTPFIAPKGRDGGVDIQAYSDPLGTVAPRIIVQVKQQPDTKVSVQKIRELSGLLRRDGDIGLFVSTGGFTSEALSEAKSSNRHMETMDTERFIDLWKTYYSNMIEEDKSLLPLREIMFLAPNS
jgi:restriction system protein